MTEEEVYKRITRYFDGTSTSPILVDVPTCIAKSNLLKHFAVNGVRILRASDYCPADDSLQWDTLKHKLLTKEEDTILIGLCDFLKLEGLQSICGELKRLLELSGRSKTLILTVGCSQWFRFNDPRLKSQGKVSTIDGEQSCLKTLLFVKPGLLEPSVYIDGINQLPKQCDFPGAEVTVITERTAADYPNSLYDIKEFDSKYKVIISNWPELAIFEEEFGTQKKWDTLFETLMKNESVEDSITDFGGKKGLSQAFSRFEEFDDYGKWFYLLSLKVFGASNNKYLAKCAHRSNTVEEFVSHIYEDILDIDPSRNHFETAYSERRILISHLGQYPDITDRFCKKVWSKEKKGLAYLSDASLKEKETIIAFMDRYGREIGRKMLMSQLKAVYPALYNYLCDYPYGDHLLDKYFHEYKYNKAINHISDEMRSMVEEQAIARDFNKILKPRSLVIDDIEVGGCVLYFMDALGAEYLSYIQNVFFENGFDFSSKIARCELPSITSVNKDFVKKFADSGCKVISRKELDEIKHEGGESYDYSNSKLPIHLIAELEIIDKLVMHIKCSLEKGQQAYIIADHGTSRLAVINEQENKWEVFEKGQHSGRCCPVSDIDEKPELATESNGFWCLANYDRFKGGRRALVEVHGGATLEEVTVPIIVVSKRDKTITCEIRNDGPILRGVKTIPILKLFVEKDSHEVEVEINGVKYSSRGCKIPFIHEFELTGIRRPGVYTFNVYCEDILIARELKVEVANQGAKERSFF